MKQINHAELIEKLERNYQAKIPIMVWGTMGIGKSAVVRDFCIAKNLNFIDVRISQLEPSDLRGLPKIDDGVTRWLPPSWLPRGNDKGILFFDEINLAPPSIQASAYQLIHDRRLGDYELPSGWLIVSAGNRIEDKANVFDLPAPLSNRFTHIELSIPTIEIWNEWAYKNDIDSRILTFLNWKRDRLFSFDNKLKEKSFGTPRSWEFCSKLIKDLTDRKQIEIEVSSAVGEGIAMEFIGFLKLTDKIDILELIENPEKAKDIIEISMKYSLISVAVDYFKVHKKKEMFEKVLHIAKYTEAEFGILLLRMMKGIDQKFFMDNIKCSVWEKDLNPKFSDYIN